MTYKEFKNWCNQRTCDGCWSLKTASFCTKVIKVVNRRPFWKRKKAWEQMNTFYSIEKTVINPINQRIKEMYRERNEKANERQRKAL